MLSGQSRAVESSHVQTLAKQLAAGARAGVVLVGRSVAWAAVARARVAPQPWRIPFNVFIANPPSADATLVAVDISPALFLGRDVRHPFLLFA